MANACAYDRTLSRARVPRWALNSTSGPALDGLRLLSSRLRRANITFGLSDLSLQIDSLTVDQAGTRATASVTGVAQVRVIRRGHQLGVVRALSEKVRIILVRRLGGAGFVVCRVFGASRVTLPFVAVVSPRVPGTFE